MNEVQSQQALIETDFVSDTVELITAAARGNQIEAMRTATTLDVQLFMDRFYRKTGHLEGTIQSDTETIRAKLVTQLTSHYAKSK